MLFFISDTHFGHYNVINYSNRPFHLNPDNSIPLQVRQKELVQIMNEHMIKSWNSVVSNEDTVYFVGDFAFMGTTEMKTILSQLKGHKILIKGNHDRGAKQMISVGFSEVHDELTLNLGGKEILLSHYPYVDLEFYDVAKNRPNILKFDTNNKTENPTIPTDLNYNDMRLWLSKVIQQPINSQSDGSKELIIQLQRLISKYIGTRPLNKGKILLHGHTHSNCKRFANMINCSVEAWNFIPPSELQILDLISEYEKEINGDFIDKENCDNTVYEYYYQLQSKLPQDESLLKLYHVIQHYRLEKISALASLNLCKNF